LQKRPIILRSLRIEGTWYLVSSTSSRMIGEQHDSNTISSTLSTNITATVERMTKSVLRADTIHNTPATRMRAHVNNSEVTAKQPMQTRVAMHAFRGCASSSSCSVLQCVAVCCSVLPCVAVCCSVSIQRRAGDALRRRPAVCCSV